MKRSTSSPASAVLALALSVSLPSWAAPSTWVATWQASPQPVWGAEFLFPTNVPPLLHRQTVRQVARISLGGQRLRLVLSNTYGPQPLKVGRVTVARAAPSGDVIPATLRTVTFSGHEGTTLPAGTSVQSDPINLPAPALTQLTVSAYLPDPTPVTTFHWEGRQTSSIVPGDQTEALTLTHRNAQTTTARLLLTGIQVETASPASAVVVLGDSITDGASASLDQDRRWPDFLAERLAPQGVAVVNAGISGARLLSDGMGVHALARLDRDGLEQPGAGSLIVLLGINDIAWPGTAFARTAQRPTLEALKAGYRTLIQHAHSRGIRVLGATLTPFEGALPNTPLSDYYHPDKDALRRQLNDWIRHSGTFDAVLDFDAALRDPAHPLRLLARYDSGDHLHPGDEGNRALAQAVDLRALLPAPSASQPISRAGSQ